MPEFLADLAERRARLLERIDLVERWWAQAQRATGEPDDAGGLVTADLARIRDELEQRRFTIGLFGLIKRGKSTLLNALLGGELSPTHVTPETAVPVHVDHGPRPCATVALASGERREVAAGEVAEWTSLKHNPRNERGVTHLHWSFPSPLLEHGARLVDTPGLDDAEADDLFTRRTVQELEAADAGIVVFMSPPTVGATEMAFLQRVAAADLRRTVLVANLVPQHFHDTTARDEVVDYVRRHVAAAVGEDVHVHAVCAEEAWQARRFGDEEGWRRSGGAALLAAVERAVLDNTGHRLLARAEAAIDRVVEVARHTVEVRRQALLGDEDVDADARRLAHDSVVDELDDLLERRLADGVGTRATVHALVQQCAQRARARLGEASSADDLDEVLGHFVREVEVVSEDGFRALHRRLASVHAEVDEQLDAEVAATLHDLGAVLPGMRALRGDTTPRPEPARVDRTVAGGAAVGGLVAGGAGLAVVGAALGPVGLVAGALAGWGLGGVVRRGRELRPLRRELDDRIGSVTELVLDAFDTRVDDLVAAVRQTSRARRAGFTADLAATLAAQDRCPPGSHARAEAVEALGVVGARLRHLPPIVLERPVDDLVPIAPTRPEDGPGSVQSIGAHVGGASWQRQPTTAAPSSTT